MTIIAVKQRKDDPYTFDLVIRDAHDKFFVFATRNMKLIHELGSGNQEIIGIPCDCSIKAFIKHLDNVHFNFPGLKGHVKFDGPSKEKIYPVCQN